jgi:hypothetical protein
LEDANVGVKNSVILKLIFSTRGAKVAFYTPEEARQKFPFINFEGVTAVTYGIFLFLLK